MSVLTYCKDCYQTVIIEVGSIKSDKVVCESCYKEKYSPESILRKNREEKLRILLKETPFQKLKRKITKWI